MLPMQYAEPGERQEQANSLDSVPVIRKRCGVLRWKVTEELGRLGERGIPSCAEVSPRTKQPALAPCPYSPLPRLKNPPHELCPSG